MGLFYVDEWKIVESDLHIDNMRLSESIMSIGNGYMGIRGNFEEKCSGDMHRGTYIAGVWFPDKTRVGWWKIGYPEYFGKVINSTNFIGIDLKVNGHEVDLAKDEVLEFSRQLDMKNGVLYRSFRIKTPVGCFEVKTERFLSIYKRETAAIRYKVRSLDDDVVIELTPYLDGEVKNEDSNYEEKFWEEVSHSSKNSGACLIMRTRDNPFGTPRYTVCTLMRILVHGELTNDVPLEKDCFVGQRLTIHAVKNEWAGIDKFVAVTTTRDMHEEELEKKGKAILNSVYNEGYDINKAKHSKCWEDRWNKSDVEIQGDSEAQQGIRFNIFQLLSTYYGEDCRLNIGPKGFTGEKYGGATYWDTEAYVFQMYLSIASPDVARNLLIYRHNQLEQAYENAAKQGLPGALYPMVTFTGIECHNEWEITFEEIHRNAAVAFAIYQYVNYTGDNAYLWEYGMDVLVGIARFWAGRVHYSARSCKYMIHGVTGPNEYENNVSNNWYTNRMAVWCLEYTLNAMEYLKDNGKADLIEQYSITPDEEAKWRDIIKKMYLPYDEKLGVFVQHDTFLDKELKNVGEIPQSERPINQNWSWDKILRSCFLKQADVLQGLYFLGDSYSDDVISKNFLFYEPMTVHESSLSACIHSVIAARLGIEEKAVDMYKRTARLDLDNYNNDTEDGLHITSMSGSWLAIVQGFAGMKTTGGKLSFRPFLPAGWSGYSFKVNYRGRRLKIIVAKGKTSITLEDGLPLNVTINNKEKLLKDYIEDAK